MKNTLILTTTHRGLSDETAECVVATECPNLMKVKGLPCIDHARSVAFDRALSALDMPEAKGIDVVLCIDDDMYFVPSDASRIVEGARATGHPRSARYVTRSGKLAGGVLADATVVATTTIVPTAPRWSFGLGFMAVPVAALRRVGERLPRLDGVRQWCQSGAHPARPGAWTPEDTWFCLHFGGVDLDGHVEVGHLKTAVLYPGRGGSNVRIAMVGERFG